MTQSVISNNNIENKKGENYFDSLLQNKNFNIDRRDVSFSKLVDNVSAKTNQVQTKFVSSAVKSNTSSINKKVLENKTTTKSTAKTTSKQKKLEYSSDVKTIKNSNIQNKPSNNSSEVSLDKSTAVQSASTAKENTSIEFKNDTDSAKVSVVASTEENTTETNISSPVSSSPVVFFESDTQATDNSDVEADIELNTTEAITMVNVVPDIKVNTTEDLTSKIDEFVSEAQIDENTVNVIEHIAQTAQENNLSQQTNENLEDLLAKLKQAIADKTDVSDGTSLKAEIKEVLDNITSEISRNLKTDESQNSADSVIEASKTELNIDKNEIKSDLIDIKNALQELTKDTDIQDKDISKVLDDVNIAINNIEKDDISDSELADEVKSLKENLEALKQVILKKEDIKPEVSDNDGNNEVIAKTDTEVENSNIRKIDEKISALQDKTSAYAKKDTQPADNQELSKNDDKLCIDLSKDTKIQQKDDSNQKLISEIINILDSSEVEADLDEIVLEPEINKIFDSTQTISETIDTDAAISADTIDEQNQIPQNTLNLEDNTQKTTKEDSSRDISQSDKAVLNRNVQSNNFDNDTSDYDSEYSNTQDSETYDVESVESDSDEAIAQNDNKQEISDIFKKDNLDLIEDITFENNFSESGALSVSDEIAKIAINTNSSTNLNNINLGQNDNIIRNISFEKTLQQSQNIQSRIESSNIFNQINEKLQNFAANVSQKLTMVLRPQDLGRLSIELMSSDKGLTTNILVQNADVRKYIEKNIEGLRQQLTNAGVNVNTIQIKTAGESGTSTFEGNQNHSGHQGENNSTFKDNQNNNQDNQKRSKNEYLANADYDSLFSKNTNDDFSSVLNNTFNYMLN